jgi:hypothetical protein
MNRGSYFYCHLFYLALPLSYCGPKSNSLYLQQIKQKIDYEKMSKFGGKYLAENIWREIFHGKYLAGNIWWEIFGGIYLVRKFLVGNIWQKIFGRKYFGGNIWWEIFGGKYLVGNIWWEIFGVKYLAGNIWREKLFLLLLSQIWSEKCNYLRLMLCHFV